MLYSRIPFFLVYVVFFKTMQGIVLERIWIIVLSHILKQTNKQIYLNGLIKVKDFKISRSLGLCLCTLFQTARHFIIIFMISTMLIIWLYAWNISSTGKQPCEWTRTDRSHWAQPHSEVWLQHSYTTKVHIQTPGHLPLRCRSP